MSNLQHSDNEDDDDQAHLIVLADNDDHLVSMATNKTPLSSSSLSRNLLFTLVVFMCSLISGGLITGVGPFLSQMKKELYFNGSYTRMSPIINGGFQIMAWSTSAGVYLLDVFGPRKVASVALIVSFLGCLLLGTASTEDGLMAFVCGYGFIGAGGTIFYSCCFHFCNLFPTPTLMTGILSSTFNFAGVIFMSLNVPGLTISVFFKCYCVIPVLCLVVVVSCFPDRPYTHNNTMFMLFPTCQCHWNSFGVYKKEIVQVIKSRNYWWFAFTFPWSALINIFIASRMNEIMESKASKDGNISTESIESFLKYSFPILTNITFLLNPWIGYMIKYRGFWLPFLLMILCTQGCVLSCLIPSFYGGYCIIFFLLSTNALAYNLQMTFIQLAYSPHIYGTVLSLTVAIQSIVGLIGWPILTPNPFGEGNLHPVLFVLFLPTFFCFRWPYILYSKKAKI